MEIKKEKFGTYQGKEVKLYTLTNDNGIKIKITNYGGIITQIHTPDRNGKFDNINLGFEKFEDYISDSYLKNYPFLGAIIGRFGNRIGGAQFTLDGKTYKLAKNDGNNTLHGGLIGFDKVLWDAQEIKEDDFVGIELKYRSKDMEEGFPGNLDVTVSYYITNDDELCIDYKATTDKATPINLTNHAYFNLNGCNSEILDHIIEIDADQYTEVDKDLIPTGKIVDVEDTPFDFTEPTRIGDRIEAAGGYDLNYVLNEESDELTFAAKVTDPYSGRTLEAYTTEPGMQLYSGNFLKLTLPGINGKIYKKHFGFCLETQHFPDAVNKPDFPTVILKPGETYSQVTVYKFGVEEK